MSLYEYYGLKRMSSEEERDAPDNIQAVRYVKKHSVDMLLQSISRLETEVERARRLVEMDNDAHADMCRRYLWKIKRAYDAIEEITRIERI